MNLLRELIFKNFGWKFLSVILASGIWLTIKTTSSEHGQTERQFLNLQIQIVSGTADVRTYSMETTKISVTVKGRPEVINRLDEREIHALVDVTSADVTQPFRKHVDVAVPSGITVIHIEPTEVSVTPPKLKSQIIIK